MLIKKICILIPAIFVIKAIIDHDYSYSASNKYSRFYEEINRNLPAIHCSIKIRSAINMAKENTQDLNQDKIVEKEKAMNLSTTNIFKHLEDPLPTTANGILKQNAFKNSSQILDNPETDDKQHKVEINCKYSKGSIEPITEKITGSCENKHTHLTIDHSFKEIPKDDKRFLSVRNHMFKDWVAIDKSLIEGYYLGRMYVHPKNGIWFDNKECAFYIRANEHIFLSFIIISIIILFY